MNNNFKYLPWICVDRGFGLTCLIILLVLLLQALTASALSGLRWTLAQILTQKGELGITVLTTLYIASVSDVSIHCM